MKRIFADYAYGPGPRAGCWWDDTCALPDRPAVQGAQATDVAIIGGGFTGISAALHLAQAGVRVTLLDAEHVGWGASGRNGGFCCLGGSMAEDAALDRRFGREGRLEYRATEVAAVNLVDRLITRHGIGVDRHSRGETELAHRARDMETLRRRADSIAENYGVEAELIEAKELGHHGMAGPFHGAMTLPIGFGLNPRKYLAGLAAAAEGAGAMLVEGSPVTDLCRDGHGWRLTAGQGTLRADQVIIATNGYSSEDLPDWFAGRYMPGQSNVLVTRPLSEAELSAAGWTTDQMAYDTRNLLHYFRLMPDRRFLFGMRGGLLTGTTAEARSKARIRRDFESMFPAWAGVESTHMWSGMVCLARDLLPFVGAVPNAPGLWAGLCYHGNGVAMGSYSGALLADLVQGKTPGLDRPQAMCKPLSRFPFGRLRRAVMPVAYAGLMMADR